MLLTFLEVFVSETLLILSIPCFIKVVHIELSHERGKVFVLKVFWKDFLGELVGPIDDKAIPLRIPKHILASTISSIGFKTGTLRVVMLLGSLMTPLSSQANSQVFPTAWELQSRESGEVFQLADSFETVHRS